MRHLLQKCTTMFYRSQLRLAKVPTSGETLTGSCADGREGSSHPLQNQTMLSPAVSRCNVRKKSESLQIIKEHTHNWIAQSTCFAGSLNYFLSMILGTLYTGLP